MKLPDSVEHDAHIIKIKDMGSFSSAEVNSEVHNTVSHLHSESEGLLRISGTSSPRENLIWDELRTRTTLIPILLAIFREILVRNASFQFQEQISTTFVPEMASLVEQVENKIFQYSLQNCEKVALVLPEHVCYEHLKDLQIRQNPHVFIGKEIYGSQIA